jgi:hypothetical protein
MLKAIYEFLTSDVGRNLLASIAALITICTFLYRLYIRAARKRWREAGAGAENSQASESASEETWGSRLFVPLLCGFLLGFIAWMATPPGSSLNILAMIVYGIFLLAWLVLGLSEILKAPDGVITLLVTVGASLTALLMFYLVRSMLF